jgi:hypothetical protein
LKANKVNLFVSSVLFVFWYHSPNFLDTPRTWPSHYGPRCAYLAEKRNTRMTICCAANFRSDMAFRLQPIVQRLVAQHKNHWTAQETARNSTYPQCQPNLRIQKVYINTKHQVS